MPPFETQKAHNYGPGPVLHLAEALASSLHGELELILINNKRNSKPRWFLPWPVL